MTNQQLQSTRDGFGLGLLQAAAQDSRVVGVSADLTESTRMQWFKDQYPDRFFQVGVAEQNLIGVAAGLALGGFRPFAASYACFSPANSWGVIRTSVCYNYVPVVVVGGHAGLVTGEDGATHQSLEDMALMSALPNMTVIVPADAEEARKATLACVHQDGPVYLRTSKFNTNPLTDAASPFIIGKANTLKMGSIATIITCGSMVSEALKAAHILAEQQIDVRVINMHTIKPIDRETILLAATQTRAIMTLEDHQVNGGLGSAVATVLATEYVHIPFKMMGVTDEFGESGPAAELLRKYRLDGPHVADVVRQLIG